MSKMSNLHLELQEIGIDFNSFDEDTFFGVVKQIGVEKTVALYAVGYTGKDIAKYNIPASWFYELYVKGVKHEF